MPGIGVQYIYALALDDSQQSKEILDAIVRKAKTENKNALITSAISQVQSVTSNSLNAGKKGLAKQVLDSAFFVSNGRQKHANARFLALNGMKDMALIEVYVNGGILAEEWYHVVLRKRGHHWEFFSISQVAVS